MSRCPCTLRPGGGMLQGLPDLPDADGIWSRRHEWV